MDMGLLTGMVGMALVLVAFSMTVLGKAGTNKLSFLVMNAIGGGFLLAYALMTSSAPFMILNSVWTSVACWGLLHHHTKRS